MSRERQGWVIVAALFVTLTFGFGAVVNTSGVFFTPLIKYFGWSRMRLSSVALIDAAAAVAFVPVVGWLLDRLKTQIIIGAGAAMVALGLLVLSRVESFNQFVLCHALVLVPGMSACGVLPVSFVVANWFDERRGRVFGIVMLGSSFGGMIMQIPITWLISHSSWRTGYLAMMAPVVVIVIPVVLLVVRARPPQSKPLPAAGRNRGAPARTDPGAGLVGYELSEALKSRSFWMLASAHFAYAFSVGSLVVHGIPYLIHAGYSSESAALVATVTLVLAATGKLVLPPWADRVTGRIALVVNFCLSAVGIAALFWAGHYVWLLAVYVLAFGLSGGAPLALLPMVQVESLGIRRFGSIGGILGVMASVAGSTGPLLTGRIFDVTNSYDSALVMLFVVAIAGAVATLAITPFAAGCEVVRQAAPETASAIPQ
ncbi:MAG TPA: MFS transporter [Candidatus Binataceae bacterium]|nr:MFS transporter [Candidatus Binataceae bacterium]